MKRIILQSLQSEELQRALGGNLNTDRLVECLVNTGNICMEKMNDILVVKFVSFSGKVIRAFRKTFRNALLSLSYQAWALERAWK